jgi:hypothetical protein
MKKITLIIALMLAAPASASAAPSFEPDALQCFRPARHHIPGLFCYPRQPPIVCGPGKQCHSWPMPNKD